MFGFEFPRNFNAPYRSESITDFWRRWHISLSTFLRDYLYLPLGGNRKGLRRTYVNLALVMLLGGLWHGANWTFVCWGAFHGALLIFERWLGKRSLYARLPRPFRMGLTFVLILFSWVLFRAETMAEAVEMFRCMVGLGATGGASALLAAQLYTPGNFVMMAVCAVFAFQPIQAFDVAEQNTWLKTLLLLGLFVFAVTVMFVQAFNPFLYFQF
jgi:alginate O-acetyltransferase complex protein AlgI